MRRLERRRPFGGHSAHDRTAPPPGPGASWPHRFADMLGRLATLLALVFIVYALVVEHDRASDASRTADRAEVAAQAARRAADAATATARDVRQLVLEAQHGRAVALRASCDTNNRQNAAIRSALRRFHARAGGFGRIDCAKLAAQARVP